MKHRDPSIITDRIILDENYSRPAPSDDEIEHLPNPYCTTCHGEGFYWEDVAGDGGSRMRQECDCEYIEDGFALDMSDAHNPMFNESQVAPTPKPAWLTRKVTVGQYTPSAPFKAINNHSCVCYADDMGLVALTGPAEDKDSQDLADFFVTACNAHEDLVKAISKIRRLAEDKKMSDAGKLSVILDILDVLDAKGTA